jgi:hypothetical protein
MTEILNVSADIASEKFYGPKSEQAKQQDAQKQQIVKQDPSTTTGVQWAATQAPVQAQAAQAGEQANNGPKPADGKGTNASAKNFEIVHPSVEDVAVLSTTVSINEEAVDAPKPGLIRRFFADRINMGALEESYKEYFKKSKSHNLLLERFAANVKFSALKSLVSLLGVSAKEQAKIQAEVKDQAIAEIDSKLKNDWAYTKAMLDITTG